jgi:AcrR family transcriptional regulator
MPTRKPARKPQQQRPQAPALRRRILDAAFSAFTERGYGETSTLEIAKRAKVSKRELYAVVGSKLDMLVTCIRDRAERMRMPADLPVVRDRAALATALTAFGERLLIEVTHPSVVAVFRLAIAEAVRAPEVARALHEMGRASSRAALRETLAGARSLSLVDGTPAEMAERFIALLWGDVMLNLLLRVADPPSEGEVRLRAQAATAAFLLLYPPPS